MKRIFTLLLAVGTFTLAQAQPGSRDNRDDRQPRQQDQQIDQRDFNDNDRNGGWNNNDRDNRFDDRFSNERKRDMEIARINREYDYKIQKVRNNIFLFRYEKERQIRFLQQDRQQEIKKVYIKYTYSRGRNDDRRDHNDRDRRHY